MQPDPAPAPTDREIADDCRALKGRLHVTWKEVADVMRELGYSYPHNRVRKCATLADLYPRNVLEATWEALLTLEDRERERRAAGGDRRAIDHLDRAERHRQTA